MSNQLTPTDLMLQARDSAETYFNQSVRIIDSKFGEGYAKTHPELIGDFMRTVAADFHTAILNHKLDELIAEILIHFDEPGLTLPIQLNQSSGKIAASCACRVSPPAPGKAHDLLQEWIAGHPGHTRKQHIFACDLFKWLDQRSIGGIQDE
ncbi:hypothetical protein [Nitrosomonas sp.]|uniref:hypothetical protein n=1 Tax=Nitrosomonas sp. TaxID=42353 RepID=UPI001D8682B3|nr:hypothetical protein [Nitrosomonas sp.]MBX3616832.1 hypothetical protein [Nitrosomonas sp.]